MLAAPQGAPLLDCLHKHVGWYDALDDLARSSLDPAFTLEQFDTAPEFAGAAVAAGGGSRWCMPLQADMSAAIAGALLRRHSLWWTEGSPSIAQSLLVCEGLPPAESFAAMLDGSWRAGGWNLPQG
jgi:type VI secretion system protein ImpM